MWWLTGICQELELVQCADSHTVYHGTMEGRPVRVEYFSPLKERHAIPGVQVSGPEEEVRQPAVGCVCVGRAVVTVVCARW